MEFGNILYFETDIICLFIMLIIGYNSRRQLTRLFDERLFLELILSTSILVISDLIWSIVDGKYPEIFIPLNIVFCSIYLFMTVFIGLIWLMFVDYKIFKDVKGLSKRTVVYSIPSVIMLGLCVMTPFTNWLFFIDEQNAYHRGEFHILQVILGCTYLVYAGLLAIVKSLRTKNRHLKKEYRALSYFVLLPIMGGLIQALAEGLPLSCVGVTLSILLIYINIQNKQLAQDALTGINNRRQLNMYVDMKISEHNTDKNTSFILIDVDKFKHINDTFGHIEGDKALVAVADLLSDVCDKRNDFLARFGGDEFAIVCERTSNDGVEKLKKDIAKAVEKINEEGELPYLLSLSMGSAMLFADGLETQDAVTALADKHLYEEKNEKKSLVTSN